MRNHVLISQPVYPRERGERAEHESFAAHASGLSPRTRGTGLTRAQRARTARFIPANAGNGISNQRVRLSGAVYPRERGERRNGH